jgi:hypothetical protein
LTFVPRPRRPDGWQSIPASTAALLQVCDRRSPSGSDGDDTNVRTASRSVGVLGAVVCVVATFVMCVAAFLPYTGGNWGDGLLTGNEVSSQVTMSIINGSDVWFVLGTVLTLGFVAAYHLGGVRRQATGFIALAASLVALGLALKLPGTWKQDGVVYGEPYLLYAGFYVFLGGAVTAVLGALVMVVTVFVGSSPKAEAPMYPSPS